MFFQALNWLLFLYVGTKGTPLGSKRGKTYIHNTQNTKASAHYERQTIINCLLRHYSPTMYSVGFSIRKRTGFAGNV